MLKKILLVFSLFAALVFTETLHAKAADTVNLYIDGIYDGDFATLKEAFDMANSLTTTDTEPAVITLLDNILLTESGTPAAALTVSDVTYMTLDLNGFCYHVSKSVFTAEGWLLVNHGNLTIYDSDPSSDQYYLYDVSSDSFSPCTYSTPGYAQISGGCISGGKTTGNGGALYNDGTLTLEGGTFIGNEARNGAAIYSKNGDIYMNGGYFIGNRAVSGNAGAIYLENSNLELNGGVLGDSVTVLGLAAGSCYGNKAALNGGAVYASSGSAVTLCNSAMPTNITANTAGNYGGGVYLATGSTMTMLKGAIRYNDALKGSAVYSDKAVLTLTGGKIEFNTVFQATNPPAATTTVPNTTVSSATTAAPSTTSSASSAAVVSDATTDAADTSAVSSVASTTSSALTTEASSKETVPEAGEKPGKLFFWTVLLLVSVLAIVIYRLNRHHS